MKKKWIWQWSLVLCLAVAVQAEESAFGQETPDPAAIEKPSRDRRERPRGSLEGTRAAGPEAASAAPAPPGPMPLPDDLPSPARFVVMELHEEVSLGMAAFVERVAAGLGQGDILVLDINTFGGRVDAAVIIRDALLGLREQGARTIAYVHPRAISAGALISLAAEIIVVAPGSTIGAATPVRVGQGGEMEPVEEKTVSYMRKEMRATAEARGRSGDIAEAMVDADLEVPGLIDKGKLLTLDGKQALAWGVANIAAASLDEAIATLGYGSDQRAFEVEPVRWSWAEKLAAFLSSAVVSGLLMSIGMLGLMIGLYTGGNPLPLAMGGICLGLFFFGHHVVDLAGIEEILLFTLGIGLLLFEVLVPGHLVPGVIGVVLIIVSLAMGLVSFEQVPWQVQWQQGWITRALAIVFGSIAAATAASIAVFQVLPGTRFGRALLLETTVSARATDTIDEHNRSVIGAQGVALSDLRPSGRVTVGGKRFDAVAEQGYIAAGAAVRVLRTRGFSIVVAAARPPAASATQGKDEPT